MRKLFIAALLFISVNASAQKDSTTVDSITVATPIVSIADLEEFVKVLKVSFTVAETERCDKLIEALKNMIMYSAQRYYADPKNKKK